MELDRRSRVEVLQCGLPVLVDVQDLRSLRHAAELMVVAPQRLRPSEDVEGDVQDGAVEDNLAWTCDIVFNPLQLIERRVLEECTDLTVRKLFVYRSIEAFAGAHAALLVTSVVVVAEHLG